MSTQKLCSRRKYTLVETVPAWSTFKSSSLDVSMMTRGSKRAKPLSLAALCQRSLLAACFMLVRASMACCQVRVAMPVSVPDR